MEMRIFNEHFYREIPPTSSWSPRSQGFLHLLIHTHAFHNKEMCNIKYCKKIISKKNPYLK
jgi:hypothetical protein